MLKIKNAVKKYRSIPVATGVASVAVTACEGCVD